MALLLLQCETETFCVYMLHSKVSFICCIKLHFDYYLHNNWLYILTYINSHISFKTLIIIKDKVIIECKTLATAAIKHNRFCG